MTRLGLMLGVLLSAMFMAQFDYFVVNVAAPDLQHDLGASEGALQLVVGGYAFAYGAGMISGGRLGDLLGHRRLFVAGTLSFAITSLLCAVAATPGELVAARLAQGVAGALMIPQILALITSTFPAERRGRALGWYAAAAGVGSIAGQVLGGLLVVADVAGLGWRVIFLVNVPLGVVVSFLAARRLPERRERAAVSLDPAGAVGVAAALGLVLTPLTLGRTAGWPAWTWISIAAALPVAVATIAWERRVARRGGTPMLELDVLRHRSFAVGLGASGAYMFSFASLMFTLTLLLQRGLGLDPVEAGLVFAPMGVSFSVAALYGRRWTQRDGFRVVVAGSLVAAAGLALLVAALAVAGEDLGSGWIMLAVLIAGAGNGLVHPAVIGTTLSTVRAQDAGAASGLLVTAQQFAGAVGVAALGAVFFSVLHAHRGPGAYATAMQWAGSLCLVAMLAVPALAGAIRRQEPAAASQLRTAA